MHILFTHCCDIVIMSKLFTYDLLPIFAKTNFKFENVFCRLSFSLEVQIS